MGSMYDMFFSPLGEEYCLIYLAGVIFTFVGLILVILGSLFSIISGKDKLQATFKSIVAIAYAFFMYILSRLAYSICKKAL
tara:strand:+ start:681 stop:923 length:243 start_codon:yes stop_codon:yes gene_type:complete